MAAKAKASSSSCLSFLKDALLLHTQNVKLFVPVLFLVASLIFLVEIADVLGFSESNNKDTSSADYAKLARMIYKEERRSVLITISVIIAITFMVIVCVVVVGFVCAFAYQVVPIFAISTTYSGDRYSLPELFSNVITRGRRLRGPLITFVMVGVFDVACKGPLEAVFLQVVAHISMLAFSALLFLAFLYLDVVSVVAIAVSVADTKRRGVSAIRQAWRLMTRVWRKEGLVLVVVNFLAAKFPSPLHTVAVAYTKKSMPMGLALLSVHAVLSGLMQLFYFTAATVYYHQATKSTKSMEVMAP